MSAALHKPFSLNLLYHGGAVELCSMHTGNKKNNQLQPLQSISRAFSSSLITTTRPQLALPSMTAHPSR